MSKISEFKGSNPYPDAEFVEIDSILNTPIAIIACETFENNKGPGAHILAKLNDKEIRLCTHGIAVCDILSRDEVKAALAEGYTIECKFVYEKSQKNPQNKVLKIVDPEA